MSHIPGGGLHSKNVVHTNAPKTEPRSRGVNPSAVNQLGNHVGDHVTHSGKSTGYRGEPLIRGSGYNNPVGPSSMALSGPGSGRDVSHCGLRASMAAMPVRGCREAVTLINSQTGANKHGRDQTATRRGRDRGTPVAQFR